MTTVALRQLDLNLLVILEALVEAGSVTGAAAQLGMTQSGASRALARLREALDDPLFVLQGHALVATPRCEALRPELARCLQAAREVFAVRAWDPSTASDAFCVAMPDHLALLHGVRLHAVLRQQAPGVDLVIRAFTASWRRDLYDGTVDLAFGVPSGNEAGLQMKQTTLDPWVVVVRHGHPVLDEPWDTAAFARGEHGLMAVRGTGPSHIDRALAGLGMARRVTFRSTSPLVVAMAAANSDIRVTTTRSLARYLASVLPLVVLDLPLLADPLRLPLVWHERFARDPRHRWLRSTLVGLVADSHQDP